MKQPLQSIHLGYAQNGRTAAIAPSASQQMQIFSAKVSNRSGGAIDVAIMKRLVNAEWSYYRIVAASTPDAIDATTAIQAGTATAAFTLVNNDGYLVQSKSRFNLIGLNVSAAASGGSPTYTYQYYNGTSYTTLTTIAVPTYASGVNLVLFNAPSDWAPGTTAAVGGSSEQYSILVRATTASSGVGGSADDLWVAQILDFQGSLADKASLSISFPAEDPLILNGGEGILPYFSGSASASNQVQVVYKVF